MVDVPRPSLASWLMSVTWLDHTNKGARLLGLTLHVVSFLNSSVIVEEMTFK